MSILHWGYRDDLPEVLQNRVMPTNLVSLLIIFFVGIPFIILTPIYLSASLTLIPAIGTLICVLVLFLNRLGFIKYTRVVLSLVPSITGFFYNMLLCGPTDGPIPSVYLITPRLFPGSLHNDGHTRVEVSTLLRPDLLLLFGRLSYH